MLANVVHNYEPRRNKFSKCVIKLVFLDYTASQKGHKCFDPSTRNCYLSIWMLGVSKIIHIFHLLVNPKNWGSV